MVAVCVDDKPDLLRHRPAHHIGPSIKTLERPVYLKRHVVGSQSVEQTPGGQIVQTLAFQDRTEPRPVMFRSVMASIRGGDRHTDHLSLFPTQWPRPVHQLHVQIIVLPHHPAVYAVDAQDIVAIPDAILLNPSFA